MPAPAILLPIAAAGAVAVAASAPAAPTNVSPAGRPLISTGAAQPGSTVGDQLASGGRVPLSSVQKLRLISGASLSSTSLASTTGLWGDNAPYSGPIDAALQAKLDEIRRYGEAAYQKLSDEAKAKAAKELSDGLNLDPPLTGDESWEDVAKIAGGAAGLAFSPLPGGAVWGPIVGAYLGVKLEELASKNVDEIKAWFGARWDGIEGWVKGAAGDIEDAAKDVIDYFGGWF